MSGAVPLSEREISKLSPEAQKQIREAMATEQKPQSQADRVQVKLKKIDHVSQLEYLLYQLAHLDPESYGIVKRELDALITKKNDSELKENIEQMQRELEHISQEMAL